MTAVYPADAGKETRFSARSRGDIERTYRSALRHSRHVRWGRVGLPAGLAAALATLVAANYLPMLTNLHLPGEMGKLVISGTRVTMQQPKIIGFTNDARPYEFTAAAAAQDITKPNFLDLKQIHAKMQMEDKSTVELTAPSGTYDLKSEILTLKEDIAVVSSSGYAARLTAAVVDTRKGNMVSEEPVAVKLPDGFLKSKRLEVAESGDLLHFDGGVSMTLKPRKDNDKAAKP